jgi:hypothetical protein
MVDYVPLLSNSYCGFLSGLYSEIKFSLILVAYLYELFSFASLYAFLTSKIKSNVVFLLTTKTI